MRPAHPLHRCWHSVFFVWLIRSLCITPLILLGLACFSHSLLIQNSEMHLTNTQRVDELRLLRQSLHANTQNLPHHAGGFAADKSQVLKALSLQVGEGLSSIEFAPTPGTKLKSVLIEGSDMFVEYDLQNLSVSTLASDALNGDSEHVAWKLESISTLEGVNGGTSKYLGKWHRTLPKTQ